MLPGELASFLQRRLFGGFATFPSTLLSFLLLSILRSLFFRYVFFSYGPLFSLFRFRSYCISFRKLSYQTHVIDIVNQLSISSLDFNFALSMRIVYPKVEDSMKDIIKMKRKRNEF